MQDDSEEEKKEEEETKELDISSTENTILDALSAIAAFNAMYEENKARDAVLEKKEKAI